MPTKRPFNMEILNNVYNWPMYYRELGYYISQHEEYERCLQYFNKSISNEPDNIRALYGRSVARAKTCKLAGAMEDIDRVLDIQPNNIYAKSVRALVTYLSCEFEEALIQNQRLLPLRIKPDNFVMGKMHSDDAIRNCILEEKAGRPLRDHFLIIRKLAWECSLAKHKSQGPKSKHSKKKKRPSSAQAGNLPTSEMSKKKKRMIMVKKKLSLTLDELEKSERTYPTTSNDIDRSMSLGIHRESDLTTDTDNVEDKRESKESKGMSPSVMRIMVGSGGSSIEESLNSHSSSWEHLLIPPPPPFPYRPLQMRTKNIENYMAERYLDKMYLDKIYLKELLDNPGVKISNEAGSLKILDLARRGYKNVYYNQELLRTRKPFYSIKFQEARIKSKSIERRLTVLKHQQKIARQWITAMLNKIIKMTELKNLKVYYELVDKIRIYCLNVDKKILPDKNYYMEQLINVCFNAYYKMLRFTPSLTTVEAKQNRVKILMGINMDKLPSQDSLFRKLKDCFVDWKKKDQDFKERLKYTRNAKELAWIYHELSSYSIELKQYEMAKLYARKSINESSSIKHLKWVICSMFLVIKIDLLTKNKNDAKSSINQTKKIAVKMEEFDEELLEFLNVCHDVIVSSAEEESLNKKILETREQAIIKIMETQAMRDEAILMFRKMASMPPSRRMSVIPGINCVDNKVNKRKKTLSNPDLNDANTEVVKEKKKSKRPVRFTNLTNDEEYRPIRKPEETRGISFMDLIQNHIDID